MRSQGPPTIVRIAAITTTTVGLIVLFAWVVGLVKLKSLLPGMPAMKINTAIGFIFAGLSLAAWTKESANSNFTKLVRASALVPALIGGATLLEYVCSGDFGIDQFMIADSSVSADVSYPGGPAPAAAVNLLLLGTALLLLPSRSVWASRTAQGCALTALLISALALLGYWYSVPMLYKIASYSSIALHTAATCALLSVGILYARPDFGITIPLRSSSMGGVMVRRLLPALLLLPPMLGWLRLQGQYLGLYEVVFGTALFTLSSLVIFSSLVWWVGRLLNRVDEERHATEASAKETLRLSEERLRLAQHVAAIGSFEWNVQTGVNTWTPELEAMYGLPPDQFGQTQVAWEQLLHEEDRARAKATVDKAFATFEPQEGDWRVVWPDGSVHWLVGRFQVFKDAQGNPLRLVGVNIDITQRKVMEDSLRESEARTSAILNAAADAIITIDGNGIIQSLNQATRQLFGYSAAELMGQNIRLLLSHPLEDYPHRMSPAKQHTIGQGGEVVGRRKDGATFPADLAVSEVGLINRRLFTWIVRDQTDRKRAEIEREEHRTELAHVLRVNTLGEMATGLAHEINQPLSAIQNFARGAIRRLNDGNVETAELIEVANFIAGESAKAATIVQGLKQYVKKTAAERRPVDINSVVRHAISVVKFEAERRQIPFAVQCPANLPQVQGDAIQLEQVVMNLLLNAIEAIDQSERPGSLIVETARIGQNIVVRVVDNGIGLDGNSSRMFEPFFTTKPQGLGMGLAISRSIIEAHEGSLEAESNAGAGATFRIVLPIHEDVNL